MRVTRISFWQPGLLDSLLANRTAVVATLRHKDQRLPARQIMLLTETALPTGNWNCLMGTKGRPGFRFRGRGGSIEPSGRTPLPPKRAQLTGPPKSYRV